MKKLIKIRHYPHIRADALDDLPVGFEADFVGEEEDSLSNQGTFIFEGEVSEETLQEIERLYWVVSVTVEWYEKLIPWTPLTGVDSLSKEEGNHE